MEVYKLKHWKAKSRAREKEDAQKTATSHKHARMLGLRFVLRTEQQMLRTEDNGGTR